MGEKINVKEIVTRKKEELKARVNSLKKMGIQPKLSVVLASEDEASKIYVGKKRKTRTGNCKLYSLPFI